jgi:hypothetical protein
MWHMDGTEDYYTDWNKPGTERHTTWSYSDVESKKGWSWAGNLAQW